MNGPSFQVRRCPPQNCVCAVGCDDSLTVQLLLLLHDLVPLRPFVLGLHDSAEKGLPLACLQCPAEASRFPVASLWLEPLNFHVSFFLQSFGLHDLALQHVQLRSATHALTGVGLCSSVCHSSLNRHAGPSDLALVVQDGSTQAPFPVPLAQGLVKRCSCWLESF